MVPLEGFEPSTCRLSGATGYKSAALPLSYRGIKRNPRGALCQSANGLYHSQEASGVLLYGAGNRARTGDLHFGKVMYYQLYYTRIICAMFFCENSSRSLRGIHPRKERHILPQRKATLCIWYTQGDSNPCSRRERAMSLAV
jgi:hypothetical protein